MNLVFESSHFSISSLSNQMKALDELVIELSGNLVINSGI